MATADAGVIGIIITNNSRNDVITNVIIFMSLLFSFKLTWITHVANTLEISNIKAYYMIWGAVRVICIARHVLAIIAHESQ